MVYGMLCAHSGLANAGINLLKRIKAMTTVILQLVLGALPSFTLKKKIIIPNYYLVNSCSKLMIT
jgi:hypothetical protein